MAAVPEALSDRPAVGILAGGPESAALAARLGLPVLAAPAPDGVTLRLQAGRLEALLPGSGPVRGGAPAGRLRAGRRSLLARAVGLHRRRKTTIVDATAGLGRDAFQLAVWGGKVTACERHPVVAALLASALAAAPPSVRARLTLVRADARDYLRGLPPTAHPAVIYLDPLWPAGRRRARPRKETALLHLLLGAADDPAALFALARRTARERVVVKRPRRVPPLAPPERTLRGARVVYDVYPCRSA